MHNFNLNVSCEVTLTRYGAKVHNEYLRPLKAMNDKIELVKTGEVMRAPLWQIMAWFGPHLSFGFGRVPFKKGKIQIKEVSNGTD